MTTPATPHGTTAMDGTPISRTDLARIAAEERLHVEQRRSAVRVVAARSLDADDCRVLFAMLGLTDDVVASARGSATAGQAVA